MQGFQGSIGRTVQDSVPHWPQARRAAKGAPNIVTVILDDTGWSDLGCFGSEIATPTIDRLARQGLRYTNFHVTPLCSPTRASLFTGRNHHAVGMRCLADTDTGFPNGRGSIPPGTPMLPSLLRDRGYATFQIGKWHLAPAHEVCAAGPFGNWPLARGFDRFYGILGGCTDQYVPELCCDNHMVEPPRSEGYHLTEDLCDHAIGCLRDHVSLRPDDPFYLNLAFGATHAPIQVPRAFIEPYVAVFAKGWDQTRTDRLNRQKALGLVPPETVLAERNPEVPAWDSLDADSQRLFTHLQAAYAGFLEHTDLHLGRVVAELERLGVAENTILVLISDNGASREGGETGAVDVNAPYSGKPQSVADQLARLDEIGGPRGPAHYPQGWAMAGNTPFRKYKQFVELGGVRAPLIVHWPAGITGQVGITGAAGVRSQFLHVIDLAPTLMDLTGGGTDAGFDGASFAHTFAQPQAPAPRNVQYWEMFGRRAIRADGWKAVSAHEKGADYAADGWSLYDTDADFSESRDLSGEHPQKLAELIARWWHEAEANGVLPLDDRTLVDIINFRQPNGLMARPQVTLFPGQSHLPQYSMITSSERSMSLTARLGQPLPEGAEGVLVASGDAGGGYCLFVQAGQLRFEHAFLGHRDTVTGDLPTGTRDLVAVLHVAPDDSATVHLFADRRRIGRGHLRAVANHLSFWGLDVGRDVGGPVSPSYPGQFPFPDGLLERIELRFLESASAEDLAALIEATE